MAQIMEYKVIFELDYKKTFQPYLDEWVNNNVYVSYRIVDEEYVRDYWTDEKKLNIEDVFSVITTFEGMKMYLSKQGIIYVTDSENKIRLVYRFHTEEVLYARAVTIPDIVKLVRQGKKEV